MIYPCNNCGELAHNNVTREQVTRYVGPNQEEIKPYVRGLGHWHCKRCRCEVKVKATKKGSSK